MALLYRCVLNARMYASADSWPLRSSMELVVVVVALIVAGALIPDRSRIVFYR